MRGLKSYCSPFIPTPYSSHPARDAWIEIKKQQVQMTEEKGRIPHGMRGLKFSFENLFDDRSSRIPHGMRGLKFHRNFHILVVM